eukprot:SAG11_NODE_1670_length_4486_cov_6.844313_1_plen_72_part_00
MVAGGHAACPPVVSRPRAVATATRIMMSAIQLKGTRGTFLYSTRDVPDIGWTVYYEHILLDTLQPTCNIGL